MTSQPLTVWTEMPVRDVGAAAAFYDAILGTTTTVNRDGPKPIANIADAMNTVGCTLFEGETATGTILHFAVPSMQAAADKVAPAGGKVISDPVEIPPGRFVYATDLDGNKIGLFEPNA